MTKDGVRPIRPISGGRDRNGRVTPEQFAPDSYALHSPTEALAHYIRGSGKDRNYYFSKIDTSHVKVTDFPEIADRLKKEKPGLYPIVDATTTLNGGIGRPGNLSSATTIGGLVLRANGVLAIARNGSYHFSGKLTADNDLYNFNKRAGRSASGEASTTLGRQLPGTNFWIHVLGSKPFNGSGRR